MKNQMLNNRRIFLFILTLFFLTQNLLSQGWENFDNSNATASYQDGSFIGNDNILWNYIASRDENGDANNSGIDGKALMLRRASDDSKVYAENIPNGIGDFSVKLYKGFTTGSNRRVELFINGISYGQSEGFNDFEEHIFQVDNINIEGEFTLEIRNIASSQVIVDDIIWTPFNNTELPPEITNVEQIPGISNVTPDDSVTVNATITAVNGVQFSELYWGLTPEDLPNTIEMIQLDGDVYTTEFDIPAQNDGATVFYQIIAWDFEDNSNITEKFQYMVVEPQWLDLPYFNDFRNEDDWDAALDLNFEFNGVNLESAGGGYLKISLNGSILTPSIDFEQNQFILTYFDLATWGGLRNQQLTIFVSDDNGDTYIPLKTFDVDFPNATYGTFAQYIDVSQFEGRTGRIKYEMTGGNASIRFRDLNIQVFQGFVYDDEWFPSNPNQNATPADDVFVLNGIARLTENIEIKNLFIENESVLYIDKILKIHGDKILVDGDLIFSSTEASDGELDSIDPETHIRGDITVERFFHKKRAYRMISSSITTSASIRENWQEGVNNQSTDPQQNQNPNPGYGTHITGDENGENGFDASIQGEPSLFENNVLTQEFIPLDNTDVNTINSADPYLIFIRGDRGIDLNDNSSVSETTLRTKGKMVVGNQTKTFPTMNSGEFGMFGNPYQSAIDIKELFTFDSEKVNINHYYVHDPNLGDFGAFVAINLADGSNFFESTANQFLQPGQAAQFVTVDYGGPALYFQEHHKTPGNHSSTNRSNQNYLGNNNIILQLLTRESFENNGSVHDAISIDFDVFYNNDLTHSDVIKPFNFFENLAVDHNGVYLIKEEREMPVTGDEFRLFITGYQHREYVIKMKMNGFEDAVISLIDNFTGENTLFVTGETFYSFEIDPNEPQSTSSDRFLIRIDHYLEISKNDFINLTVYPNPIENNKFNIGGLRNISEDIGLVIRDVGGRKIMSKKIKPSSSEEGIRLPFSLQSGLYFIEISVGEMQQTFKIINN